MNEENKKDKSPSESSSGGSAIRGVIASYKAEFRKIVWPSRETLFKHTVTVIAVSLMFGAYIAVLDGAFGEVFRQFVGLIS